MVHLITTCNNTEPESRQKCSIYGTASQRHHHHYILDPNYYDLIKHSNLWCSAWINPHHGFCTPLISFFIVTIKLKQGLKHIKSNHGFQPPTLSWIWSCMRVQLLLSHVKKKKVNKKKVRLNNNNNNNSSNKKNSWEFGLLGKDILGQKR